MFARFEVPGSEVFPENMATPSMEGSFIMTIRRVSHLRQFKRLQKEKEVFPSQEFVP